MSKRPNQVTFSYDAMLAMSVRPAVVICKNCLDPSVLTICDELDPSIAGSLRSAAAILEDVEARLNNTIGRKPEDEPAGSGE